MDTILFNGKQYPLRKVDLDGEWVMVAPEALESKLVDKNGNFVSSEAKAIDDTIYCYVPSKKFGKADKVLRTYVMKNFY